MVSGATTAQAQALPAACAGGSPFHATMAAVRAAAVVQQQQQQPPWTPVAPSSPSAAATAAAAALAVGAAQVPLAAAAAMPPAGFRQPIYNRDGKFVGWKQNSNYLKPLAPAASPPASAPSSPSKSVSEPDAGEAQAGAVQTPKAALGPRECPCTAALSSAPALAWGRLGTAKHAAERPPCMHSLRADTAHLVAHSFLQARWTRILPSLLRSPTRAFPTPRTRSQVGLPRSCSFPFPSPP